MKTLNSLNPVWFVRESIKFMEGYPKRKIWFGMLPAYIRYCYHTLKR